MFEMNGLMNGVFLFLFGSILVVYVRFVYGTLAFLLKGRPLTCDHKWLVRFPLSEHAKNVHGSSGWQLFGVWAFFLLGCMWYIQLGGSRWYALFAVTVLFACTMLMKEFRLRYYLAENTLTVWSVHRAPCRTADGKERLYAGSVRREEVVRIEKKGRAYYVYVTDERYLYVRPEKEGDAWKKWLGDAKVEER